MLKSDIESDKNCSAAIVDDDDDGCLNKYSEQKKIIFTLGWIDLIFFREFHNVWGLKRRILVPIKSL
jgi:hypothetical protein